jgi:hypothetical protein
MTDRGHPVEAPTLGEPAEAGGDLVQPLDQMGLVLALGDPGPPPARVRQHPEQQMRGTITAPRRRRIGQLYPIPLGLLAGRVLDHRPVLVPVRRARRAPRPQLVAADRGGERLIRPRKAQAGHLVEQRRRPQMRIIIEPLPAIRQEVGHRLRPSRLALTRHPFAVQIRPDRLAVMTEMSGDRADRPPLRSQCLRFHAVLPCQHRDRPLRRLAALDKPQPRRGAVTSPGTQTVCRPSGEVDLAEAGSFKLAGAT